MPPSDYPILEGAQADYESTVRYLAEDLGNPKAAVRFTDEFDRPVGLTCAYPETHASSPLPELAGLGYRPMRAMNCIALYKVVDDTVAVAHIFHERQGKTFAGADTRRAERTRPLRPRQQPQVPYSIIPNKTLPDRVDILHLIHCSPQTANPVRTPAPIVPELH